MQIEMTIDAKGSEIPPLVSESGILQGRDLMMDLKPPCPAALGTSPAIPIQDPPPDPLPAIPREIRTPLHPTIDDSKAGVDAPFLLTRSHPPAARRSAAAASSRAQLFPLFLTRRKDP